MKLELVSPGPDLDQDEIRELVVKFDGNVTKAAQEAGIDPQRLRSYVRAMPALRRACEEALEQGVDAAIDVLFEGLRDQGSFQNRYYAAKEFLRSEAGRRRGFGREPNQPTLEVQKIASGAVTIKWLDPPDDESCAMLAPPEPAGESP